MQKLVPFMNLRILKTVCLLFSLCSPAALLQVQAQEFEHEPIEYSKRSGNNRVTQLMADIQSGKKALKHEPGFGYLRSLLSELQVPESSQTLVFSKTSLQRQRISPATPRAKSMPLVAP